MTWFELGPKLHLKSAIFFNTRMLFLEHLQLQEISIKGTFQNGHMTSDFDQGMPPAHL